jgi:hypothetical protein
MINPAVPIPQNLPLLLNDPRPNAVAVAAKILKHEVVTHRDIILELSKHWKIHVWFSQPVTVAIQPHWVVTEVRDDGGWKSKKHIRSKVEDNHIFKGFFRNHPASDWVIYYKTSTCGRHGHDFEDLEDKIVRYEPVIQKDSNFESYEQFKAKFDPQFITENYIKSLWNGTSSQHGGKYRKSDFHFIGEVGRKVLKRFMQNFKGVANHFVTPDPYPGYKRSYVERHTTTKHPGRDITIEHNAGGEVVFYQSEYAGCGNGRYGLVANKNQFLHLEDD